MTIFKTLILLLSSVCVAHLLLQKSKPKKRKARKYVPRSIKKKTWKRLFLFFN